jgi:hypothetical protein
MTNRSSENLTNSKIQFSLPQLQILISTYQINLFLAGVGSGKTHLDGHIAYKFIEKFPGVLGFIGANTFDQLNTSTTYRIREVWKSIGIYEYEDKTGIGHYVVNKQPPKCFTKLHNSFISYDKIISFVNGATIFLGSMDNAKAHDGKEFGWAILDETKDTKEDDVKDIILARLRQKGIYIKDDQFTNEVTDKPCCPLYISTSPAKVDWINNWFELDKNIQQIQDKIYDKNDYFVKRMTNKLCVISSTYHNEHNLPNNYIENKRTDWTKEKFKTLIYANPFSQTGSEYYSSFDRVVNVGKNSYDPEKPLHISFDFNYVPYNSCSIWQVEEKDGIYYVYGIDEIALKNPRNSDEEMCNTFLARYQHKHKSRLFVYGDATGKAGSTIAKESKSHILNLEKYLAPMMHNQSMRIPRANPTNDSRREFINRIFENKIPVRIIIDESMSYMISDLSYTKQDLVNGGKDKHIVSDPETKDKYQKYGHFGDNFEYFICECFKSFFIK